MKILLPFVMLALVCSALPLRAAPDYTELNQAATNYFAVLDAIVKKLPAVDNAAATVEVVNAWAGANESFAAAGEHFAAQNPGILNLPEPPPEFAATYGRLNHLKTDYPTLPASVGELIKRFHEDPDVAKALARFQKSLARIQQVGPGHEK